MHRRGFSIKWRAFLCEQPSQYPAEDNLRQSALKCFHGLDLGTSFSSSPKKKKKERKGTATATVGEKLASHFPPLFLPAIVSFSESLTQIQISVNV